MPKKSSEYVFRALVHHPPIDRSRWNRCNSIPSVQLGIERKTTKEKNRQYLSFAVYLICALADGFNQPTFSVSLFPPSHPELMRPRSNMSSDISETFIVRQLEFQAQQGKEREPTNRLNFSSSSRVFVARQTKCDQ